MAPGWYMSHCDDDWEHDHGVTIETVENPGWMVRVDLEGTELATRPFAPVHWATGSSDWYDMHVGDSAFIVACSPLNLSWCLTEFRFWAQSRG